MAPEVRRASCSDLIFARIWELATAIKVSSNLAEKFEIAYEMRQLGDLSRDLSDEISCVDLLDSGFFHWLTFIDLYRSLAFSLQKVTVFLRGL